MLALLRVTPTEAPLPPILSIPRFVHHRVLPSGGWELPDDRGETSSTLCSLSTDRRSAIMESMGATTHCMYICKFYLIPDAPREVAI